jgi:hypothetical protein
VAEAFGLPLTPVSEVIESDLRRAPRIP